MPLQAHGAIDGREMLIVVSIAVRDGDRLLGRGVIVGIDHRAAIIRRGYGLLILLLQAMLETGLRDSSHRPADLLNGCCYKTNAEAIQPLGDG